MCWQTFNGLVCTDYNQLSSKIPTFQSWVCESPGVIFESNVSQQKRESLLFTNIPFMSNTVSHGLSIFWSNLCQSFFLFRNHRFWHLRDVSVTKVQSQLGFKNQPGPITFDSQTTWTVTVGVRYFSLCCLCNIYFVSLLQLHSYNQGYINKYSCTYIYTVCVFVLAASPQSSDWMLVVKWKPACLGSGNDGNFEGQALSHTLSASSVQALCIVEMEYTGALVLHAY